MNAAIHVGGSSEFEMFHRAVNVSECLQRLSEACVRFQKAAGVQNIVGRDGEDLNHQIGGSTTGACRDRYIHAAGSDVKDPSARRRCRVLGADAEGPPITAR